ncbi:hypothetical protein E8E95_00500 [Pseudomonas sp. BN414]|uniref:hypothetical protein n=1 Tax=Pseudomonas sp. BN414 TaxID=2567888 RepID=UPI0024570D4A|nr:hypothetical protein [Pseudomonas sp. BN414]MDH4565164.1 hypothetical protein [Pseudomonas sp. BN414]
MTPEEMGLVFNQLVARRTIYSFAASGRRRSQEEKDAVEILERQYGRSGDLEEFLRTQGLRLQTIDAFALGLANTGRIYVAVRDPIERAPEHLATSALLQELIDERRSETAESSAIWATFFLLVLLYFLYTTEDRPIEAISAFKDSSVDLEQFLEEVRHRIEQLRVQSPPAADSPQRRIHDALTNVSDAAIESRVKAFFSSMLGLGVLEPIPGIEGYRQTLWSAVDIATNFQRHAGSLAMAGLDGITTVAVPEAEATPDQAEG